MTSAHSMHSMRSGALSLFPMAILALPLAAVLAIVLGGCETVPKRDQPMELTSPYLRGQLWAVVPPINESGYSEIDTLRVADLLTEEAQQVQGIDTIPVNRVVLGMSALDLPAIATAAEARALIEILGVDGLIVGSITAYDPYAPLKLGVAIQLFTSEYPGSTDGPGSGPDPRNLTRAVTDDWASRNGQGAPSARPTAQAVGVFDASNHLVLTWLDEYTTGRTEPESAYGASIYLVSMEMYTQFVAHRLIHDLLVDEQARITRVDDRS